MIEIMEVKNISDATPEELKRLRQNGYDVDSYIKAYAKKSAASTMRGLYEKRRVHI